MFGLSEKRGEGGSGGSRTERTVGYSHVRDVVVSAGGNGGYHQYCQRLSVEFWSSGVSYEHCRRF